MALTINTNIASLNAQRNLGKSQNDLSKSMERLSSGLRINSAKDDAAGLAISDRMTSQIRGLNQAARNANDGISLAQTAEGALQESTNILQRMRELAIQSANDTNSASDRSSMQAEVNQLKQELARIAESTSFNGRTILDGTLSNAQFQIGANKGETITVSIGDMSPTQLGVHIVTTSNPNGIEAATNNSLIGENSNIGTEYGAPNAAATNGATGDTLTVTYTNQAGANINDTYTYAANAEASAIAAGINNTTTGLTGVTATAFNQVTVTALADVSAGTLKIEGQTVFTGGTDSTMSDLASNINNDTTLQAAGIYAVLDGGEVAIYATDGRDLSFVSSAATIDIDLESLNGTAATVANNTQTFSGRVDLTIEAGVTFDEGNGELIAAGYTSNVSGHSDGTAGNNVGEQTLTIVGPNGSTTADINENDTAYSISQAVNAASGETGVVAYAETTAFISNISDNGTVSFYIYGDNDVNPTSISATITSSDITPLVDAINDQAGTTGVQAVLHGGTNTLKLTLSSGRDIRIENFQHSASINYATAGTLTGDGSGSLAPNETSMIVTGGSGQAVILTDGGVHDGEHNSTVIGGEVSFNSNGTFNVTSSISGSAAPGSTSGGTSLFSGAANSANASTLDAVNEVDISTQEGASAAIAVLDGAIGQVDELRGDLGAIQNRFESTISNLQNISENLSAARSRILDADIAQETSAMTKSNILQQAGVAILAQANQTPQLALQLLQG